jgi:hypothetical protein
MAHQLGPDVDAREGSLVEPMAIGMPAIRRLEVEPGDLVAVHGCASIGLGAALGLKTMGMRVVAVDPSALRLGVAKTLGVAALAAAVERTAIDGTVVVVSFPLRPIELSVATFRRAEVGVTASVSASAADHDDVIEPAGGAGSPIRTVILTSPISRTSDQTIVRFMCYLRSRLACRWECAPSSRGTWRRTSETGSKKLHCLERPLGARRDLCLRSQPGGDLGRPTWQL